MNANDHCCPQCFSPCSENCTGFEASWFRESDYDMRMDNSELWRVEVAWSPNQDFCKLSVSTGIVDIYHMTRGEKTEEELRRLLRTLFKALNLLFKVADNRELHTDWAEYMSLLELVKKRMIHLAAVQLMRRC